MVRPVLYHYWRSSSSWRVRWALSIKGVEHDAVAVDLRAGEQHAPIHLARNPMGHVPALVMGDRCLGESVAIFEYLEETIPSPPLYPTDPWLRARTRQIVELVNAGVQPLQNLGVLGTHSHEPARQKLWAAAWNARGLSALETLLGVLEAERGGPSKFCIGDTLTAADLFLVPQVYSARRFDVDVSVFPRVLAIEHAAMATPHAEAALPERQPDAPR
jgi:maleylacetoacetate isomerase